MEKLISYLLTQLHRYIAEGNTKEVKYYYEILQDFNIQKELQELLDFTNDAMKKAKLYLVEHLDKFPT